MKKYIFLVLVTILCVLILLYLYDKKELVINNKYESDNIYIEYPYFNNKNIDLYIDNYLNNIINNEDGNNYFVDYDYIINGSDIDLVMYKYIYYDNVLKNSIDKYTISIINNNINKVNNNNLDYMYNNKIGKGNNYKVAFVFDGNSNINTIRVLDILSKYNVIATFCINDNKYRDKLKKLHMEVIDNCNIDYNINSLDDKYHSSKMISKNVLDNIHNGDIIYMHSIYSATVNSLNIIIPILISNGYKFVSVNDLNRI